MLLECLFLLELQFTVGWWFFLTLIFYFLPFLLKGSEVWNLELPLWHSKEITLYICFVARFSADNHFVTCGSSIGEDLVACSLVDGSYQLLHSYSFMLLQHKRCALFNVLDVCIVFHRYRRAENKRRLGVVLPPVPCSISHLSTVSIAEDFVDLLTQR